MVACSARALIILLIFIQVSVCVNSDCQARPPADTLKPAKPASFYLDKGRGELDRKQNALALRSLSVVIRMAPDAAEAYRLRGIAAQRLGMFHRATKDFTRYIEMKPRDPEGYVLRGDSRNFNQEHAAAIEDYNTALKLSSRLLPAYVGRGLALAAMERYDEAIKDYLWVLTLEPNNTEAAENMAIACMQAGRSMEAVTYFEKALATENDPVWRGKIERWLEQVLKSPQPAVHKAAGPTRRPAGPTARPSLGE
jgi:tetratricopeptide (TPR) repeat protein